MRTINHLSAARVAAPTRAAAVFALALAMTLVACHPDDNRLADADQTPVPLCANATLPTTAQGTVTRADAGDAAPIQLATDASLQLRLYANGSTYSSRNYSLQADANATTSYRLTCNAGNDPFHVVPGSQVDLRLPQTALALQMALKPNANGTGSDAGTGTGSSTGSGTGTPVQVPFRTNIKYPATDGALTAIGLGGAATLPLQYTTCALRLRLKYADGGQGDGAENDRIATVQCPLPMTSPDGYGNNPETSKSPTRTDGKTDDPATPATEQTVIFGQLTPGQALQPGSTRIALLTTAGGDLLSLTWPAGATIKQTPAAGQMLTLTVHVGRSVAYIDPAGITISGFQEQNGDGDGEDLVQGYQAKGDGMQTLNLNVFCAARPVWTVTGGGTEKVSGGDDNGKTYDEVVLRNVRTALNKIYTPGSGPYTGTDFIDLTLEEVTTLLEQTTNTGAFKNYKQLRNVSLPEATTIGMQAFDNCSNLTSVNLPAATGIGLTAFYECKALTSISLPKATTIETAAFYSCEALASVSLPEATTIGKQAFYNCKALTSISVLKATDIGEYAFYSCKALASISMPEATTIGKQAFYYCETLASISVPKATSIGEYAFYECKVLTSLDLSGITQISDTDGLHSGAFDSFGNSANCTLVLNKTAFEGSSAIGTDATTGKPTFLSKTWKSITYKDTPSN